jgi:hypothetical protein
MVMLAEHPTMAVQLRVVREAGAERQRSGKTALPVLLEPAVLELSSLSLVSSAVLHPDGLVAVAEVERHSEILLVLVGRAEVEPAVPE